MATLTRYLVIKVQLEVDMGQTDQKIEDHQTEIVDYVVDNLDYSVTFDQKVESGYDAGNAIEVPVKIVGTEVQAMLDAETYYR